MGVAFLTIVPSDPPSRFLAACPPALGSAGLEVLVPKGIMLPPRDTTMIPSNYKLRLPPGYFWLLMLLNQQAKRGSLYWLG